MRPESTLRKVAEITLVFWVAKVIATTLGEVAGDVLAQTLNLGYVVGFAITMVLLAVLLALQLRARGYNPLTFWATIVGTTTVGTEIADMATHTFGLGYVVTSAILFAGVLMTLVLWYRRRGTCSVDSVVDRESEMFFWIAVLFSNSLGTAFGDGLVYVLGLTYTTGSLVCLAVIVVVLLLHYVVKVNAVVIFWAAFVFTRPFGADFGNLLTKQPAKGGLGLDTIKTAILSAILLAVIVAAGELVGQLPKSRRKSALQEPSR